MVEVQSKVVFQRMRAGLIAFQIEPIGNFLFYFELNLAISSSLP